jgi:4-amino-4-deoxy-L-arabinose transferase-like glycosyltransferase
MSDRDENSQGKPPAPGPRADWWIPLAGLGVPALVLFLKLGAGGIWDPYELTVADLSRRIAVNLWGARSLVLSNADNGMPTLGDLGRGELPFTSVGAGFAVFGLHEWAGRLPLALWGMAGAIATYLLLSRLADRKTGAYGAVVLATMPLYFVHARTMLGDIVTMAALAIAIAGLGVAAFDRGASLRLRLGALAAGLLGLCAGQLSRGSIVGLAVPLLAVGLTWAVLTLTYGRGRADALGKLVGAPSLLAGLVMAMLGARALFSIEGNQVSMLVGAAIAPQSKFPTFDFVILYLGHALFPWSAFVPLAVGRLFRPPHELEGDALDRAVALRTMLLVGSALAFGAFAMLAPRVGHIPFSAVALLAGIAAVAIRDYERGAPSSRALGIAIVTLVVLFYRDFDQWPEKGLSAFGVAATTFPETFKPVAIKLVLWSGAIFAALSMASWLERDEPGKKAFDLDEYLALPRVVRTASSGNLMFVLVVVEATLAGFALLFFIGLKAHWKQILTMSANVRVIAINAWWVAPVAIVGVVGIAYVLRDLLRVSVPRARLSRASLTLIGGAVAGALLAFSYYPRLAAQLSPKDVFDSYAKLHKGGEQLALLGVNSRTATYYSGSDVQTFADVDSAYRWLMEGAERRWLAFRSEDLPRLNSAHRARARPQANLPVLDGHSGQVLLGSNRLLANDRSDNPLDRIVLPEKPRPAHPLDVDLQGQILSLGWEVVDQASGKPVPTVVAGKKYRMRLYYQCSGRVSGEWESFIHIDGHQRRFNGDHKPMDSKYPMSLWQPGDYLVDDYEFALEPNFTPGSYMLYFGFFIGETRLKVTRGKHHEDRIEAGTIQVQ